MAKGIWLALSAGQSGQEASLPKASSSGTHVIEGLPLSRRTVEGLRAVMPEAETALKGHRSTQIVKADLERSTLVAVMERDHVSESLDKYVAKTRIWYTSVLRDSARPSAQPTTAA